MSALKKSASRRKRKSKATARSTKASNRLPHISAILDAFNHALALVTVAHQVIAEDDDRGPEAYVLRIGVKALDAVYNRLDKADVQITRFSDESTSAPGGAS